MRPSTQASPLETSPTTPQTFYRSPSCPCAALPKSRANQNYAANRQQEAPVVVSALPFASKSHKGEMSPKARKDREKGFESRREKRRQKGLGKRREKTEPLAHLPETLLPKSETTDLPKPLIHNDKPIVGQRTDLNRATDPSQKTRIFGYFFPKTVNRSLNLNIQILQS